MLVYGDTARTGDPPQWLARVAALCRQAAALPPGIERHGRLVAALIEVGELGQGIADAIFVQHGADTPSAGSEAVTALLMALARAVRRSWSSGFTSCEAIPPGLLEAVERTLLPTSITGKRAEGFAFYALYPEAYAAAAETSGLGGDTRVVGIRSIGLPLAAMTASALGASPPLTIRPVGHPFERRLSLSRAMDDALCGDLRGDIAIVDEGPGLSGSSFGAVADHLEARGVAPARLVFFPGHTGEPGPMARARHRARWATTRRIAIGFDELVLDAREPVHRLDSWVASLIGPLDGPLDDISGGAWRSLQAAPFDAWPPVHAQQERRKFLARADGATWLVKFAGLGAAGDEALALARQLQAAGFTPPVAGLVHGFLVERWLAEARPLTSGAIDPLRLAEAVGHYLAFRARTLPAEPGRGAALSDLVAMARHNTAEALGHDTARLFDPWDERRVAGLAERVRPVLIDGRLQPWEWLLLPDGSLRKADALEHHAGHDLVGCQDIAWDVAGAAIELDLPPDAQECLASTMVREGARWPDPDLLALLALCYLAFRLGASSLAAESGAAPDEAQRLRRAASAYGARLGRLLRDGG
ncbi:phosphoribosyltransferase [Methylobacterium nodulans]|uniref:Uncharacterized protein n=1 Tax=Methylobacterium nodulans (strain LMG 21967 / CNCM I-2342 / ORS 2060) TaxID=460265 RepID=B8IUD5_METNO|nr:phosphoribosyltransferase [Methylobacterium nodulans]ACL55180.1 conserved hypothetical protein [Methylobacterium nodulans ORS 2060]